MAGGPGFLFWRESDRAYLLPMLILAVLLGLLLGTFYIVFTVARVDGDSMYPALHDEDRVLLTRGDQALTRGDIVALVDASDSLTGGIIKRVVAVAGDEVSAFGDTIYVNSVLSTAAPDPVIGPDTTEIGSLIVPEGTVYVLGDNRPLSLDSRIIGPVPLADVQGRVVAIILPLSRFTIID